MYKHLVVQRHENMKISIKSEKQIEKMRIAGKLAAEVLEMIEPFVIPGVSTEELDKKCYEHIVCLLYTSPSPRDKRQ